MTDATYFDQQTLALKTALQVSIRLMEDSIEIMGGCPHHKREVSRRRKALEKHLRGSAK